MRTSKLETARLLLRPFEMEDAQDVFEGWETDPDVARYMYYFNTTKISRMIVIAGVVYMKEKNII